MRIAMLSVALMAACSGGGTSNPGGDGDDAPPTDATVGSPDAPPTTGAHARVFITSDFYTGDLKTAGHGTSGLDGADKLCQLHADASSLAGTFRAYLSSSTVDAIDRIEGSGPWYNTHDELVFANRAQLQTHPVTTVGYADDGHQVQPLTWTGTSVGRLCPAQYEGQMNRACADWTSASAAIADTATGDSGQHSSDAWQNDGYDSCYMTHALYCFQVTP